jgi:oxygen-dependent protoporphyrinogen oxidase
MQQMTDALISRISKEVFRSGVRVEAVKPESGKWLVINNGRTEEFDAVVIATPAHAAAVLMSAQQKLTAELNAIPYTSSMTVVLGYDQQVRSSLPAGFGFLVPRTENRKILAATFVHNKFPYRAPENRAIIRCFIGGSVAEEMFEHGETDIASVVGGELKSILGLNSPPLFTRVYKWRKAMAQYTVGHSARVSQIKSLIAQMPGLALAGNAYSGIGVPDCVRTGSEAAVSVMTSIGFESPS